MYINKDITIEEGQNFEIDILKPEDATGVSHLFHAVYGPDYPIKTYYEPEKIIEENRKGNIYSVVARTDKGEIIAHGALYRSSPPNSNLYECGQYIVLPSYRTTFAVYKINRYVFETLMERVKPDGIFGEGVCNHIKTQKMGMMIGFKDVGIEIDLMPYEAYIKENSAPGRVSCLVQFLPYNDTYREVFIPDIYRGEIEYILSDLNIKRTLTSSYGEIPSHVKSNIDISFFIAPSIGRFNVITPGSDFNDILEEIEEKGKENKTLIFQFFINLDKPWVGKTIENLRKKGYFFGGYIPQWFKTDGILMQKILTIPDFDNINLYTDKAKKLLDIIKLDREKIIASYL